MTITSAIMDGAYGQVKFAMETGIVWITVTKMMDATVKLYKSDNNIEFVILIIKPSS